MSEGKKGFWESLGAFFGNLSLKIKLVLGAIFGILSFVFVFLFQKRMNAREILELELQKLRTEIEIEKTQNNIDFNQEKINLLEVREKEIREELEELAKFEAREDITNEELDEFFDDRGF